MSLTYDPNKAYETTNDYDSLSYGTNLFLPGRRITTLDFGWNKLKHPVLFQVIPYLDPKADEGQREFPTVRQIQGEFRKGPTMLELPVLPYMGSESKLSCVLFNSQDEQFNGYDASENPYIMLYRRVRRAVNDKVKIGNFECESWAGLLKGSKTQGATLPAMTHKTFIQTLGWHDGVEPTIDKEGRPIGLRRTDDTLAIGVISRSASKSLEKQVIEAMMGNPPYDPFALANGYYVGLYKEAEKGPADVCARLAQEKIQKAQQAFQSGLDAGQGTAGITAGGFGGVAGEAPGGFVNNTDGDDEEYSGYGATIAKDAIMMVRTNTGEGPQLMRHYDLMQAFGSDIMHRWKPWDQIIRLPSHEELCVWIAKALSDKRNLLEFAWGDSPYLTQDVLAILAKRRVVPTGASSIDDGVDMNVGFGQTPNASQQVFSNPQQHSPATIPPNAGSLVPDPAAAAAAADNAAAQAAAAQAAAAQAARAAQANQAPSVGQASPLSQMGAFTPGQVPQGQAPQGQVGGGLDALDALTGEGAGGPPV